MKGGQAKQKVKEADTAINPRKQMNKDNRTRSRASKADMPTPTNTKADTSRLH